MDQPTDLSPKKFFKNLCKRQGEVLIKAFAFLMLLISCPYSKCLHYDLTLEKSRKAGIEKCHNVESGGLDSVQALLFSV